MADMNVNLQGNMDRLGSILRDGEVDKTELSQDIDTLFEAKQDGGDDPVDFNDYAVALASHADSISPKQVDEYLEIMKEFAGMDGDANSLSQTEVNLMKQILAGEDTTETLQELEDLKAKQAEIDRLEEEKRAAEEANKNNKPSDSNSNSNESTISDADALSYAKQLHEATAGKWGTDEDAVESILYSDDLSSKDIVKIMNAYEAEYGKSLEKAIKNDFSGKAEDRLLDVLNDAEKEAARDSKDAALTDKQVQNIVKQLYEATAGKWGTDEDAVNSILLNGGLSNSDIQRIKAEYKDQYGKSLESAIKNDFSGSAEDALIEVLDKADS